jgi:hypothetical protein
MTKKDPFEPELKIYLPPELYEISRQTMKACRAKEEQSIAMLINLQPNWFVSQSHLNVPDEQDKATGLRKLIDTLPSDILGTKIH